MPTDIADNTVVTGDTFNTVKPGEVKMFTKCCKVAKTKLCMHQDVKNEAESNSGPMEDILQILPTCHATAARQEDGLDNRWHISSFVSTGATQPGASLLRC